MPRRLLVERNESGLGIREFAREIANAQHHRPLSGLQDEASARRADVKSIAYADMIPQAGHSLLQFSGCSDDNHHIYLFMTLIMYNVNSNSLEERQKSSNESKSGTRQAPTVKK